MRGWSFKGLVDALGTAAFKAVGLYRGQVPLVGDKNLLTDETPVLKGFNFTTYQWRNNEQLLVEGSSSIGFPNSLVNKDASWRVEALCVDNSGRNVSVRMQDPAGTVIIAVGKAGVWSSYLLSTIQDLTRENINNFSTYSNLGTYSQQATASALPELGYPIQEAGVLEVLPSAYRLMQRYTTHSTTRCFIRNMGSNGDWSAWKEQLIRFSELDVDFGKVRIRRNAPLVFTDSNGSNTLQIQPSGSGSSVVTLHGNDETNKLRLLLNGNIRVTPESAGWYTTYDQPDFAGAYSCGAVTVPGNGYFYPLISCKLVTKDYGYPGTVSFGAVNSTTDFPNAVISLATRSGGDKLTNFKFMFDGRVLTDRGQLLVSSDIGDRVTGCRLGGVQKAQLWEGRGYTDTPPYVITGVNNNNYDEVPDDVQRRPLQYYIAQTGWVNFGT